MRRAWIIVAGLALAGCVAEPPPPQTSAYVEVSSGGAFSGSTSTRVHADDRVETIVSGPFGKGQQTTVVQGRAGLYQDMLALFRAEAPAVAARQGDDRGCEDYGSDLVRIEPPASGISAVSADCPDPAVSAFQRRMLGVIAAG